MPLVYWRKWRIRPVKAATAVGGGGALLVVVVLAATVLRPELFPPGAAEPLLGSTLDAALIEGLAVQVELDSASVPRGTPPAAPTVPGIQAAGVLRVGYNPNVAPFSYRNASGALVGYDISFAYRLAHDLSVKLVLVPFTWDRLADDLAADRFDLAISGIYLTETRLADLTPGPVYWSSPLALLVPSATAGGFTDRAALLARKDLRIAVFDSNVMRSLVQRLLPNAAIRVLPDYSALAEWPGKVDGALWTLVQARAWAETHPGWTAVVPTDAGLPLSIAMMLPPNALAFRAYLQDWTEQQRANGFATAQADYWMDGKPRAPERPRWNLLDALSDGH